MPALSHSHELALALAIRLASIVPPPLAVRNEGGSVVIVARESVIGISPAAEIADESDGRSLVELVASASSSVLSGVQDVVMRHFAAQWPLDSDGRAALPYARIEGHRVAIGFESAGGRPVLELAALTLEGTQETIR